MTERSGDKASHQSDTPRTATFVAQPMPFHLARYLTKDTKADEQAIKVLGAWHEHACQLERELETAMRERNDALAAQLAARPSLAAQEVGLVYTADAVYVDTGERAEGGMGNRALKVKDEQAKVILAALRSPLAAPSAEAVDIARTVLNRLTDDRTVDQRAKSAVDKLAREILRLAAPPSHSAPKIESSGEDVRAALEYLHISTAPDGQWADQAVHGFVSSMLKTMPRSTPAPLIDTLEDAAVTFRKATPAENMTMLKARLSEHLSPAEQRELDEVIAILLPGQPAPPSSTAPREPKIIPWDKSFGATLAEFGAVVQKFNGKDFVSLDDYRKMEAHYLAARSATGEKDAKDAARWRWLVSRINYRDEIRTGSNPGPAEVTWHVRCWKHDSNDFVSDSITATVDEGMRGAVDVRHAGRKP